MEKTKTLAAKLCDIMAECKNIPKNGKNNFQGYKYVMAADAAEYIRELMVKHGVIVLPVIKAIHQEVFKTAKGADNYLVRVLVDYTLVNSEDPKDTYVVTMAGTGSDTSDKAIFKAITGSQKYFIFNTFLLGGDDDPEKDDGRQPTKQPTKPQHPVKPATWTGEAIVKGGEHDGVKWKDVPADWLELKRHNTKNPEAMRLIEAEINRRDEEAFNNGGY